MSPAEVIAKARRHGVTLTLSADGTSVSLYADAAVADDALEDVIELVKAHKSILVAHLETERRRINHWIADKLIDRPPSHCLRCRKPIIVGQTWTAVANGEAAARFHQSCHGVWLEQQEFAARRALGLI
jgi:hypothetical protein